MKKSFMNFGLGFRGTTKSVTAFGAVGFFYDLIMEASKANPNKKSLVWSGIGFLSLTAAFIGINALEGKRAKADNAEEIKKKSAADESEAQAYTKKREADAALYKAKAEVDVWKAEAMKALHTEENKPVEGQQSGQEVSKDEPKADMPLPPVVQNDCPDLDFAQNRLFDKIIHRGDRGMFFGPKGIGKSLVTFWIAINVAEGKHVTVWKDVENNTIAPTKVLYYDLELTDMDIHNRYGKYGYKFPQNFIRHDKAQISSSEDIIKDLRANVRQSVAGAELFVVVDNIKKAMEITCGQTVKSFSNSLKDIEKEAEAKGVTLTILLVNHPTKDFNPGDSLELGGAAGSTELRDFLNFVIAIEPTKISKQHKILKVLNIRGEMEPDNVAVVKFENATPYAHPVVLCEMEEDMALKSNQEQFNMYLNGEDGSPKPVDKRKESRTGLTSEDWLEIRRLYMEEGKSPEQLAIEYGPKCKNGTISDTTIRKHIKKIEEEIAQQQEVL